jgi:hypothetical protein
MVRGMRCGSSKAAVCILLWPVLALSQTRPPANPQTSAGPDAKHLPDAPSTSIARERRQQGAPKPNPQTWWLVAPATAPYRPLTRREKFHSFLHYSYSPYTLLGAAYDATWAQALGDPHKYGGGMEGWGKRLGAATAGAETRSFFGTFFFPVLLHQDPRYFAMYKGPVPRRAFHAVSRVFVTRADDGRYIFNSSGMLTIAFTESLSMAWVPEDQRTAGHAFTRMLGDIQGDAVSYVLREFTPDFLRLFKRHAPERLKRIEEKLPPQMIGAPST